MTVHEPRNLFMTKNIREPNIAYFDIANPPRYKVLSHWRCTAYPPRYKAGGVNIKFAAQQSAGGRSVLGERFSALISSCNLFQDQCATEVR
jgi:hypothetical protein